MHIKLKQRRATRCAATDIARLFSERISTADEKQISRRRQGSQPYRESFLDTVHALADFDKLENDPDLLALVGRKNNIKIRPVQQRWPKLAMAALILLGVGMGFYLAPDSSVEPRNMLRHVTRVGEQKTINLQDGSVITLNTGSELLVDAAGASRRVILQRGEAFFDIASDPERPFSVALGDRVVSVLGTQFNIRKEPQKFTLAVVEGVVAVHREGEAASPSSAKLTATPGKTVQVNDASPRRVEAGMEVEFDIAQQQLSGRLLQDSDNLYSWRTGVIRFDAVPLYKVVKELNRYSGRKILIEDASIIDLRLYASVHLNRLDTALSTLERTLPVNVTYHFDRIVIERK